MSLRRFTDPDAQTLRALVSRYGIDGVAMEFWVLMRQYPALRFRLATKAAKRLAYAAGLAMGTAPKLTGRDA